MSAPETAETPAELERVFRGDAEGEAYHGPALRPMLAGLTAARAAARPIAEGHSIVEIVRHVAAWLRYARVRIEGDRSPTATLVPDDGWVAVATLSGAGWLAAIEELDTEHDRLVAAVRAADAAVLARERDRIRFVLHHGLHHAGQVGLLRKAT